MILTQYLINLWKDGKFDVNEFMEKEIDNFLFQNKDKIIILDYILFFRNYKDNFI